MFVAVEPPEPVRAALRALSRPDRRGLRWTPERNWHVTLRFLGEVDDAEPVVAALGAADLGPRVRAEVGPRTEWLNRNVLVVPVRGLDDLAGRVRQATTGFGDVADTRRFDGHLTIARRRRGPRPAAEEGIECSFPVSEVVLFSSTLSSEGATHDAIARFDLSEPRP